LLKDTDEILYGLKTMNKTYWLDLWADNEYVKLKENNFKILDKFLKDPPKNILDIGCGLAFESERFQKKYNTDLWLLDSDTSYTENRPRSTGIGEVDTFRFYNTLDNLKKSYNERNLQYTFVDANKIDIDENVKFDVIYSILSCGFHYPAITYKNLINKHSHENTKVILDIRKKSWPVQKNDFKTFDIIHTGLKHYTCQITFK